MQQERSQKKKKKKIQQEPCNVKENTKERLIATIFLCYVIVDMLVSVTNMINYQVYKSQIIN